MNLHGCPRRSFEAAIPDRSDGVPPAGPRASSRGGIILAVLLVLAAAGRGQERPESAAAAGGAGGPTAPGRTAPPAAAERRAEALRRICERLGVGPGASIADVGAGGGADTFTFAGIVGPSGKVYSEEITEAMRAALAQKARDRGLAQVEAVLGATEDPRLPDGAIDLVYMNAVFHHFAKPRSMLAEFIDDLKPGGFLVIVDREEGPQREWPEMANREKKHFLTGETTVVRMALEAGFRFETLLDDLWFDTKPFVLVFRRPDGLAESSGEAGPPPALDGRKAVSALPPLKTDAPRLLFVGLDQGRALLGPLRSIVDAAPRIQDVVIEEWTTFGEEGPPEGDGRAADLSVEVVRTARGDLPALTHRALHAAVFADAYSRLWDPAPLLRRLRDSLTEDGYIAVLDRAGPADETRRLAGHRRRIAPSLVKADMERAGFSCVRELDPPSPDRFFLLFRPAAADGPPSPPKAGVLSSSGHES